jgi:hypothetical protein
MKALKLRDVNVGLIQDKSLKGIVYDVLIGAQFAYK